MGLERVELARIAVTPQAIGVHRREVDTYRSVVQTALNEHKAFLKCLYGRELVNELVVATIGRYYNLPIPRPFLVQAKAKDFPQSKAIQGLDPEEDVYVFGSEDVGYPTFSRFFSENEEEIEEVLRSRKFRQWGETIIFDDWVANVDRHLDNLLLISEEEIVWIDHARSFTGDKWKADDLEFAKGFKNKLADRLWPKLSMPERMALRTRAEEMSNWFENLPYEQVLSCSKVTPFLQSSDAEALIEFIERRVWFLDSIVADRLGIPKLDLGPTKMKRD